jgi:hypothetical protein
LKKVRGLEKEIEELRERERERERAKPFVLPKDGESRTKK